MAEALACYDSAVPRDKAWLSWLLDRMTREELAVYYAGVRERLLAIPTVPWVGEPTVTEVIDLRDVTPDAPEVRETE